MNDGCAQIEDKEDGRGGGVPGLDESDRQREEKVTRKYKEQKDSSRSTEMKESRDWKNYLLLFMAENGPRCS